jgi:hypothetical protein
VIEDSISTVLEEMRLHSGLLVSDLEIREDMCRRDFATEVILPLILA